jgi:hypothetical protein
MEVNLTVHVGTDVVTGCDDLAIGSLTLVRTCDTLEVLDTKRHVARPGRRVNAQALGKIEDLHIVHEFQEFGVIHIIPPIVASGFHPRR